MDVRGSTKAEIHSSLNDTTPSTVTLTFRLIRSFEFRNWRPLVIGGIHLNVTTEELEKIVYTALRSSKLPTPFKEFEYDCFKIEHQPFGHKSYDTLINTQDDDILILKPYRQLATQGIKNETEISFFRLNDYLEYKNKRFSL